MRARFANCVFDSDSHELTCGGEVRALQPKAFVLLDALLRAHPAAVSKRDLYEQLWPGVFVEEGNLHNLVADIREAIGDSERKIIRTVHRVGYVLAAELVRDDIALARLVVGSREWPLPEGETIVGRDMLGSRDVSRRHARIILHGLSARVEDLGSKNGTFVRGKRIEGEADLADGDEIIFGMTRAIVLLHEHTSDTMTAPPDLTGNRESARGR